MDTAFKPLDKHRGPEDRSSRGMLDCALIGDALIVQHVQAPNAVPEWARWLEEIGFIVGERVMLMARGLPGGDPLVVRIGQSTFALRRAEAACVCVAPAELTDLTRLEGSAA
jgi:ferrous iron transport protein A